MDVFRSIRSDLNLQYRVELAASGMIDEPSDRRSMSERLQMLQAHVSRSRRAAEAIAAEARQIGPSTQLLVLGDTVVYCTRRKGRTEIEILTSPHVEGKEALDRIKLTLSYTAYVEAVDLSQDLLVISKISTSVLG